MTLISAENMTRTRGSSSASLTTFALRSDILKTEDGIPVRAMPTRSYSKLIQKKPTSSNLVEEFINTQKELESYKNGKPVFVDGQNLSIAAVTAAARYGASVTLDESPASKAKIAKSRKAIADKVDAGLSVYGVSTGFGGSADTRTDQPILLGNALLQHQQSGVLPSSTQAPEVLPLLDPLNSSSMPEAWVRGAILIRMNSLIRGHSGVRYELIEKMNELLCANITPLVPLRGTISASGDLSPLSYIAGTLIGNPSIRVFDGPAAFGGRQIKSSVEALEAHGIAPIPLVSKEHLGILNGTAFSASLASLALNDAIHLTLLSQVLTAMGTEALAGTRASFDPFISSVRPHPGQVETAKNIFNLLEGSVFAETVEEEVTIDEDDGKLRQDRYPLRTAPQFIGPQVEDLLQSLKTLTIECNSTTDNPLVDGETNTVHHGGNFQAMSVTNVMEKTRLSLHHLGKILFGQCAELINPAMNRGLPPSLAATDPSLNYHAKGIDIASAAYVAELGYLANPVSTHIQSAEMHNQAVNSLALISARATVNSLDVLSILMSSYLYAICQALDLRAMQREFHAGLINIVHDEFAQTFGTILSESHSGSVKANVVAVMADTFDATSTMDARERMHKVAASSTSVLLDFFTGSTFTDASLVAPALTSIPNFRLNVSQKLYALLDELRSDYLSGKRGPAPASRYLNKTRSVYEFVRLTLGIRMHGSENYNHFANGAGVEDVTVGQNVSLIHEAIRDGRMQPIIVNLFASL